MGALLMIKMPGAHTISYKFDSNMLTEVQPASCMC